MKQNLYNILSIMVNLECAKCRTSSLASDNNAMKEAMRNIQNSLIRDVLPTIQNHKFGKNVKSEVVAHVGGHNNCRAMSIRAIRKFCEIPADKNLILID